MTIRTCPTCSGKGELFIHRKDPRTGKPGNPTELFSELLICPGCSGSGYIREDVAGRDWLD